MNLYIVRFIRKDGKPNEEYYYPLIEQAEEHFFLFLNDDSELYSRIELLDDSGSVIREKVFPVV